MDLDVAMMTIRMDVLDQVPRIQVVVAIEWELNQTDEPTEALGLLFKKTYEDDNLYSHC
jgi:hypothetical protein